MVKMKFCFIACFCWIFRLTDQHLALRLSHPSPETGIDPADEVIEDLIRSPQRPSISNTRPGYHIVSCPSAESSLLSETGWRWGWLPSAEKDAEMLPPNRPPLDSPSSANIHHITDGRLGPETGYGSLLPVKKRLTPSSLRVKKQPKASPSNVPQHRGEKKGKTTQDFTLIAPTLQSNGILRMEITAKENNHSNGPYGDRLKQANINSSFDMLVQLHQ
ncbi:hypothetical protein PCANC_06351 [Puccinia coronata f. sp. avenae]|uniref:Uncharacterized protein n=1 Tax=Puccinia coronata f. sp. avenae TaxID=200324 RepID=A0A2N5S0V0_9BASI|nr:hypothetical protein PCASD_21355 [Puccinia coronata f. sp. avenae]PLW19424.1 hypothetical protein PCANC_06351 [Puccinia coronata f. sp. avenae]